MLYALLTGRPPFAGDGEFETLRKVLTEDPVRPRAVAPQADPDLETVCLKCLEKDPARRYPSAEAVADELDRWLRGEAITARPLGPLSRGARWVRRNPYPTAVLGIAGLLFAVVAVAAGITLRLNGRLTQQNEELDKANGRLIAALTESQAARDLEARNSALAREAIAGYDRVGNSPELRAPGQRAARQRMHEEALCYYQRFAEQNGPDGTLARESLDARLKTAQMCLALDRGAEAVEHLRFITEWGEARLRADPDDRHARHLLACGLNTRGAALAKLKGHTATAVEAWRECERVGRPIADADPATAAVLADAAQSVGRAVFVRDQAAGREAFASARRYAEVVARFEPAPTRRGLSPVVAVQLAEALAESDAGNFSRAIQLYHAATDDRPRLVAGGGGCTRHELESTAARPPSAPPTTDQIVQTAIALRQLGEALHHSRQGDPLDPLDEATYTFQQLARDNPDVPAFSYEAGVCRNSMGLALVEAGELDQAVVNFSEALRRLTRTVEGRPIIEPEYRVTGVSALLGRGRAYPASAGSPWRRRTSRVPPPGTRGRTRRSSPFSGWRRCAWSGTTPPRRRSSSRSRYLLTKHPTTGGSSTPSGGRTVPRPRTATWPCRTRTASGCTPTTGRRRRRR